MDQNGNGNGMRNANLKYDLVSFVRRQFKKRAYSHLFRVEHANHNCFTSYMLHAICGLLCIVIVLDGYVHRYDISHHFDHVLFLIVVVMLVRISFFFCCGKMIDLYLHSLNTHKMVKCENRFKNDITMIFHFHSINSLLNVKNEKP